jgi:hypothetical protein
MPCIFFIVRNSKIKTKMSGWHPSLCQFTKKRKKAYRSWKKNIAMNFKSRYEMCCKNLKKTLFKEAFKKCQDAANFWKDLNKFSSRRHKEEVSTLTLPNGKAWKAVFTAEDNSHCQFSPAANSNLSSGSVSVKWTLKRITATPYTKAPGPDGIPIMVIKQCALINAPYLEIIANRWIAKEEYPDKWKVAPIAPIPKVAAPTRS